MQTFSTRRAALRHSAFMPPLRSHTVALTDEQAEKLHKLLVDQEFKFASRPYTICFAQKPNLTVAVYEKGPKAVIQGKGTREFIEFILEPEILGEARLGYEELHILELMKVARVISSARLSLPVFMLIWRLRAFYWKPGFVTANPLAQTHRFANLQKSCGPRRASSATW